jgi:hypothetical protein
MRQGIVWKQGDEKTFDSRSFSTIDFIPPRSDYWCTKCGKEGNLTEFQKLQLRIIDGDSIKCPDCKELVSISMSKKIELSTMD